MKAGRSGNCQFGIGASGANATVWVGLAGDSEIECRSLCGGSRAIRFDLSPYNKVR